MKTYLYSVLIALFAVSIFVGCSDDTDGNEGNTSGNEDGELKINGETYTCKAASFTGNSITSSAIDDVEEKIRSIKFMKSLHRKGEESLILGNYDVHFEFSRINFDEISKGDELTIISGLVFSSDEAIIDYLEGTVKSGNIAFVSLSSDQTLVRLSFNNVQLEVYDRENSSSATFVLDGSVAYRRNDIMTKPEYPYADISINSQKSVMEVAGLWAISQKPYEDKLITSAFTFNDAGKDVDFYIQLGNKYGDDFSSQLHNMVGINLASSQYATIIDRYRDNMANASNCYVSGQILITEIQKESFLFMYPNISFDFQDLVITINAKKYTINGKSKVVYEYHNYY
ncbi:MAG: hypothetical protein LUF01_08595 [Bacteroides sp.]|nr:hypothetical protein [Bacteroides sp.]